ncbi:nickel pincer cofactor biosynthesis protein LarC [Salinarchaeum sp. Harcht-Bsk1]|uniref:nickel pincer cofactor biosynthesis protein LarC n=1 Tax=Salinarchaeum sp. Harcht-Bsk1 TaxID=1333523 RepID=UPI0006779A60|nr:nickel pincer cofactor biosynthesis protein LarC [Salinarchaeum sp. Harcht-Bsk1]
MTTLAFDGRTGASGDLLLGALLAAGADRAVLAPVEDALPIEYDVETVEEVGISATRVRVLLDDSDGSDGGDGTDSSHGHHDDGEHEHAHHHDRSDEHSHDHGEHDHGHGHDHEHSHHHDSGHDHDHGHDRSHDEAADDGDATPAEGHGPHRTYAEVREIVADLPIPEAAREDALAIFELLGEAEAAVHGTDLDATHFHEVGADDAIADVVGAALLLDDLDVDSVVTTPVAAGGGEDESSHGTYPVPAPAVVELAERADWELEHGPVDRELLTPTGAAILAHVAEGRTRVPPLRVAGSGYGAGGYDLGDRPNVLRAIVGEERGEFECQPISVLETNVDDVAPEVLGDLQDSLAAVGAKDVTIVPTTMKKSRPGHLVKVIVDPADSAAVARTLAEETGSLGVREAGAAHRWVAERRIESVTVEVDGESFPIEVKVGTDADGSIFDVSAEYDDAAAVARETGLAFREVARRAEAAARAGREGE